MSKEQRTNSYNDAVDGICDWLEKYKTLISPYQIVSILAIYAGHIAFLTTNGTDEETYNMLKKAIESGKLSGKIADRQKESLIIFDE